MTTKQFFLNKMNTNMIKNPQNNFQNKATIDPITDELYLKRAIPQTSNFVQEEGKLAWSAT